MERTMRKSCSKPQIQNCHWTGQTMAGSCCIPRMTPERDLTYGRWRWTEMCATATWLSTLLLMNATASFLLTDVGWHTRQMSQVDLKLSSSHSLHQLDGGPYPRVAVRNRGGAMTAGSSTFLLLTGS